MSRKFLITIAMLAGALTSVGPAVAASDKPTVVLVHGAFAESSSWDGVVKVLQKDGFEVVAAANPLRSVKGDAQYVSSIISSIKGPVVLVGHSYGGMVISDAANGQAPLRGGLPLVR